MTTDIDSGTANAKYLFEHGPTPTDELPGGAVSTDDKCNGVAVFKLLGGAGSSDPIFDMAGPRYIAYLYGLHTPEAIIRAFFDANPEVVERSERGGLSQRVGGHGAAYKDAVATVWAEYHADGGAAD